MEIKNRLFPYPVLCNENDDYEESSFYGKCNLKEELSDIMDIMKKAEKKGK